MNRKLNLGFILFLSLIPNAIPPLHAAEPPQVANVSFYETAGAVVISYDLLGETDQTYAVQLAFSDDGGATFTVKPAAANGDIGKGISPGRQHRILWHFKQDYPQGLSGNRFVCEVRAHKPGKTWPWLVGGGALLAGGAAVMLQPKKEEPTTGKLAITVPGHP